MTRARHLDNPLVLAWLGGFCVGAGLTTIAFALLGAFR